MDDRVSDQVCPARGTIAVMDARVTPIWPGADEPDPAGPDGSEAWLSTEVSIEPETRERAEPFETVSP